MNCPLGIGPAPFVGQLQTEGDLTERQCLVATVNRNRFETVGNVGVEHCGFADGGHRLEVKLRVFDCSLCRGEGVGAKPQDGVGITHLLRAYGGLISFKTARLPAFAGLGAPRYLW